MGILKSGKTGYWDILYIYLLAGYPFLPLFKKGEIGL